RNIGLDVKGALAATFGITALVYGIIQGSEAGWTSLEIVGSFALASVLLVVFAQVERTAEHPMLPLHFFKQKDFSGAVLVLGLAFFSAIVVFFFLVQYFQLIQGRSPFETGLMVLPNAGAIVLAAGIAQWALPKFGPRSIVSIGVSIMALGVILFTTVDEGTAALSSIGYIMVFGFGFGLASQPLTDTVMAAVPIEDAGIGSAVNDVSRELGSALGIAILGSIVSSFYRSNIETELAGQVPDELIEVAGEGLGVLGVAAQQLEPDVAATLVSGANTAFIDAMTAGFWLSAGFLGIGVLTSLFLLPKRSREDQVIRDEPSVIDVPQGFQPDFLMIPGTTEDKERAGV
ncbi:MAG: hypothetical protein ACI81L_003574, partial [Verrucomicrobiales bacterium]